LRRAASAGVDRLRPRKEKEGGRKKRTATARNPKALGRGAVPPLRCVGRQSIETGRERGRKKEGGPGREPSADTTSQSVAVTQQARRHPREKKKKKKRERCSARLLSDSKRTEHRPWSAEGFCKKKPQCSKPTAERHGDRGPPRKNKRGKKKSSAPHGERLGGEGRKKRNAGRRPALLPIPIPTKTKTGGGKRKIAADRSFQSCFPATKPRHALDVRLEGRPPRGGGGGGGEKKAGSRYACMLSLIHVATEKGRKRSCMLNNKASTNSSGRRPGRQNKRGGGGEKRKRNSPGPGRGDYFVVTTSGRKKKKGERGREVRRRAGPARRSAARTSAWCAGGGGKKGRGGKKFSGRAVGAPHLQASLGKKKGEGGGKVFPFFPRRPARFGHEEKKGGGGKKKKAQSLVVFLRPMDQGGKRKKRKEREEKRLSHSGRSPREKKKTLRYRKIATERGIVFRYTTGRKGGGKKHMLIRRKSLKKTVHRGSTAVFPHVSSI